MRRNTDGSKPLTALIRIWLGLIATLPMLNTLSARISHKRRGAAPERFCERLGQATAPRPAGTLVWIHAVSVGEVNSVARLARQMAERPDTTVLITTVTATGAATAARAIPEAVHQFMPVDTRAAVMRFLAHWRPDAALFVEGDLWPRMFLSLADHNCPMALLNARTSRTRTRFPKSSAALLSRMELITVQEPGLVGGLIAMGLDPARIHAPGNLKADIAIPDVDEHLRDQWIRAAQGRGLWAAVSTHPGEETLILETQQKLQGTPLLILVPRHPNRGDEVARAMAQHGITFTRHSEKQQPGPDTAVHLVDALGITGTVFAASGLAFIGGSLVKGHGGHTPYEPAALGCAVLSGPHVQNFASAYAALEASGGGLLAGDATGLLASLQALLSDEAKRKAMQRAAGHAYATQGGANARTLALLRATVITAAPASTDPAQQL